MPPKTTKDPSYQLNVNEFNSKLTEINLKVKHLTTMTAAFARIPAGSKSTVTVNGVPAKEAKLQLKAYQEALRDEINRLGAYFDAKGARRGTYTGSSNSVKFITNELAKWFTTENYGGRLGQNSAMLLAGFTGAQAAFDQAKARYGVTGNAVLNDLSPVVTQSALNSLHTIFTTVNGYKHVYNRKFLEASPVLQQQLANTYGALVAESRINYLGAILDFDVQRGLKTAKTRQQTLDAFNKSGKRNPRNQDFNTAVYSQTTLMTIVSRNTYGSLSSGLDPTQDMDSFVTVNGIINNHIKAMDADGKADIKDEKPVLKNIVTEGMVGEDKKAAEARFRAGYDAWRKRLDQFNREVDVRANNELMNLARNPQTLYSKGAAELTAKGLTSQQVSDTVRQVATVRLYLHDQHTALRVIADQVKEEVK